MNLWILSDLHLEFFRKAGQLPQIAIPDNADMIILAGDIDTGIEGIRFAEDLKNRSALPVVYVAGNHEYYGAEYLGLLNRLKEEGRRVGVDFLEQDSCVYGDIEILGATLWTDYRLYGAHHADEGKDKAWALNDFRVINYGDRRFAPEDAQREHFNAIDWLTLKLEVPTDRKRVVVSHHLPHPECIAPQFIGDPLNSSFASDLDAIFEGNDIDLWVHGHTHDPVDVKVHGTRIVCNPHGYIGYEKQADNYNWGYVVSV